MSNITRTIRSSSYDGVIVAAVFQYVNGFFYKVVVVEGATAILHDAAKEVT